MNSGDKLAAIAREYAYQESHPPRQKLLPAIEPDRRPVPWPPASNLAMLEALLWTGEVR